MGVFAQSIGLRIAATLLLLLIRPCRIILGTVLFNETSGPDAVYQCADNLALQILMPGRPTDAPANIHSTRGSHSADWALAPATRIIIFKSSTRVSVAISLTFRIITASVFRIRSPPL
jgi:hypothetical protein